MCAKSAPSQSAGTVASKHDERSSSRCEEKGSLGKRCVFNSDALCPCRVEKFLRPLRRREFEKSRDSREHNESRKSRVKRRIESPKRESRVKNACCSGTLDPPPINEHEVSKCMCLCHRVVSGCVHRQRSSSSHLAMGVTLTELITSARGSLIDRVRTFVQSPISRGSARSRRLHLTMMYIGSGKINPVGLKVFKGAFLACKNGLFASNSSQL